MEKINIHHIGGIGECGPVEKLLPLNKILQWVVYDANQESLDTVNNNYLRIPKCIGGVDGLAKFNVVKVPSASSLLKMANSAKDYCFLEDKMKRWRDSVELIKTEDMQLYTLDTLIKNNEIPIIDVLSIDVQGAEYEVMTGLSNWDDVLMVITESEFAQIYEGQKLFGDQFNLLISKGFRLVDITNQQFWYTSQLNVGQTDKSLFGDGFLTVAETVYLKDYKEILKGDKDKIINRLLKLLLISMTCYRMDYADEILRVLLDMGFKLDSLDDDVKEILKVKNE